MTLRNQHVSCVHLCNYGSEKNFSADEGARYTSLIRKGSSVFYRSARLVPARE